jgi:hypothetical protein
MSAIAASATPSAAAQPMFSAHSNTSRADNIWEPTVTHSLQPRKGRIGGRDGGRPGAAGGQVVHVRHREHGHAGMPASFHASRMPGRQRIGAEAATVQDAQHRRHQSASTSSLLVPAYPPYLDVGLDLTESPPNGTDPGILRGRCGSMGRARIPRDLDWSIRRAQAVHRWAQSSPRSSGQPYAMRRNAHLLRIAAFSSGAIAVQAAREQAAYPIWKSRPTWGKAMRAAKYATVP